jgi:colanic acid/amylovoran biosynthesis protein
MSSTPAADQPLVSSPEARNTRRKICILGASLDVGNRGVQALAVSLVRLSLERWPAAELSFLYEHDSGGTRQLIFGDGRVDIPVRNCRWSPRSKMAEHILVIVLLAVLHRLGIRGPARGNPWLSTLLDADFVGDIRGGDSFSDTYGLWRFLAGSLPLLSVAFLGRPYTMLPQTYGPFRSAVSRGVGRYLLRRARSILTRDRSCDRIVRELCGRSTDYCPDVAFALQAERPEEPHSTPDGLVLDGCEFVIGLNVSGLLYMGGYTGRNMFGLRADYREVIDLLAEELLRSTTAKLLLVPHVFGSEQEQAACASILRSLGDRHSGRVFAITGALNERELKWTIGRTQLFIGSRMHACIAALSQNVPCVGLAYSDKFRGVFASVGAGDTVVDLRQAEPANVISKTISAVHCRADLQRALEARMPAILGLIERTFADLLPT